MHFADKTRRSLSGRHSRTLHQNHLRGDLPVGVDLGLGHQQDGRKRRKGSQWRVRIVWQQKEVWEYGSKDLRLRSV